MQGKELDTEYLGRAIASMRTARGMKRMDLKHASGLSYPYIAEIENGTKKSPSLKAIGAIAAALGVSPAELQARAEELEASDVPGADISIDVMPVDSSITPTSLSGPAAAGQVGTPEEELTQRIAARVLDALGPQVRELVAREVRYAVREELLQRREAR